MRSVCYWLFNVVLFAVDCLVSSTVIQLFTCGLMTCTGLSIWCRRVLNVSFVLRWPCAVDRMLKSKLTPWCRTAVALIWPSQLTGQKAEYALSVCLLLSLSSLCLHLCLKLAHTFLFCSCVYFCLYDPFKCISFHKSSRQLSTFSLCSSGLISALLVLSTTYLFMKVSFSPGMILCGWLGSKHQLTN